MDGECNTAVLSALVRVVKMALEHISRAQLYHGLCSYAKVGTGICRLGQTIVVVLYEPVF